MNIFERAKCKLQQNRWKLTALLGIVLLVSIPLFCSEIRRGHDLLYHVMRIRAIAFELKQGNFPVKMSGAWLEGYGYPSSIMYGDLLLYFPAVLYLLLGKSRLVLAYQCFVLFINFITVLICYYSFRQIFRKDVTVLLVTAAYCTANYRMVDLYVRAAAGEYSAMAFLPLIAAALWRMYCAEERTPRYCCRTALLLAIGMTGVIQTHILSAEIVVVVLVVICILLLRKTLRLGTIATYLLAVVETVLLNLFFLVPFLDYWLNVDMNIQNVEVKSIQGQGLYIAQLFDFFFGFFGSSGKTCTKRMGLTPGWVLMLALVVALLLIIGGWANKKIKLVTLLSVLSLWVSSDLFCWNYLRAHFAVGKFLSQVQFPWRYLEIACILLAVLLGFVLEAVEQHRPQDLKKLQWAVLVGAMVICFVTTGQYLNSDRVMTFPADETEEFVSTYIGKGKEYLRHTAKTKEKNLTQDVESSGMEEVQLLTKKGTFMVLYCRSGSEGGEVTLPLFMYKGYQVTDEAGRSYELYDGDNCRIAFQVPAGFDGELEVRFVEPQYWRMSEWVSLVTLFGIVVLYSIKKRTAVA